MTTTGVVVMAYGTPTNPDAIAEFYTDVRRGHPPTQEQLDDLVGRYAAIGGISPLNDRTTAQIAALQAALDLRAPQRFRTYYGSKHAHPKIETAVERAADDGCDAIVGLVLAPHFSILSVGEYIERAADTARELGLRASFLRHWHDEPALIDALCTRIAAAFDTLTPAQAQRATLVVTAHSLPARIRTMNDPYADELQETAQLVAGQLELNSYQIGWQSAGKTSEPWLGPDICETVDQLAGEGASAVVVCPAGFTSDHLEVLYDLDIVAADRVAKAGVGFARTASLNAEPSVFAALAHRVLGLDLQGAGGLDSQ